MVGRSGRYGTGHAWVEFFEDGRCYLVEPQLCFLGEHLPRLSTLRYRPYLSVAWDGEKFSYYQHRENSGGLPFLEVLRFLPEYIFIWARFWLASPVRVPRAAWWAVRRFFKGFRWVGSTRGV